MVSCSQEIEEVTEDSEFNKQLGLIKNQLASLRQLPSLIETQLNLFQTQIDCLVELKHKESRTGSVSFKNLSKSFNLHNYIHCYQAFLLIYVGRYPNKQT